MKKRVFIIILSIIVATALISGGYGKWEKSLIIKEYIEVIEPKVDASQELDEAISDTLEESGSKMDDGVGLTENRSVESSATIPSTDIDVTN